jgi:hypothetical protein
VTATSWRKCPHPRTPENTYNVSVRMPGGRCRICFLVVKARYGRSEKGRACQARANARYRASAHGALARALNGIQYAANRRGA